MALSAEQKTQSQQSPYITPDGLASVGKFASNTGQGLKFLQMIEDAKARGEDVDSWTAKDWVEFGRPLLEAYKARRSEEMSA